MPRRRRGAIDDDSSDNEVNLTDSDHDHETTDIAPQETVRARNQRLRRQSNMDTDTDRDEPIWPVVLKTNSRQSQKRSRHESDDEYTEEESGDNNGDGDGDGGEVDLSEEEIKEEYSDGGFVVDSDDNLTKTYGSQTRESRNQRRNRRKMLQEQRYKRRQKRKAREMQDSDSIDDEDSLEVSDTSIAEELREIQGPPKKQRHYRSRPPVDYSIPPPPTIEEVAKATESSEFRRNQSQSKDHRLRRLFDVRGPFGGRDVVTLFQTRKSDLESLLSSNASILNGDSLNNSVKPAGDTADVDPIDVGEDVDFTKVGGLDDYISKLKEMISLPLLYPELYERFGITPPRGVLFHGPPGTGKTLMARALAASHKKEKVTFYMRKGADVLSKWIGESERQLRALFDEARAHQPSIIFFDEIDGLAPVRSAKQEQHHASIVSTLLALMDGMDNRGQVVVIGATNRPDSVDPALRRPGRFDREFYFPLPDRKARKRILEIHTEKWKPPLSSEFLDEIAMQTKGFGGADLRALTTEAALLAIHHSYPQIYSSSDKLLVNPEEVKVRPQDFTLAMERIQPSSARPSSTMGLFAKPLPQYVEPLLRMAKELALRRVKIALPSLSTAEDTQAALFLDAEEFANARYVRNFLQTRVNRPRLLLKGRKGSGQKYLLRAITDSLEGVYVVELSAASLSTDTSPENAIVSAIAEARRRSPSCLVLPDISEWEGSSLYTPLLVGMLRSLLPTEQVLVLGACDYDEIDLTNCSEIVEYFHPEFFHIELNLDDSVLSEFFAPILSFIKKPPTECLEAREIPKQPYKPLPPAPVEPKEVVDLSNNNNNARSDSIFTEQDRSELRVRSQLKLKLGVILDGFRQRFRRFRKPVVEEESLAYLFDFPITNPEEPSTERYIRTDDDMILDQATNKKYHNMDLETIEDRLWNGYYCETLQFLDDIEKIYKDSVENGERERMHKASEMLANAQVAIDDINADKQFAALCHSLRLKDAQKRLREIEDAVKAEPLEVPLEVNPNQVLNQESMGAQEPNQVPETMQAPMETQDTQAPMHAPMHSPMQDQQSVQHLMHPTMQDQQSVMQDPMQDQSSDMRDHMHDMLDMHDTHTMQGVVHDAPTFSEHNYDAFVSKLFNTSRKMTLDQLEQLSATLSKIEWTFRQDWNRDDMLQALQTHLDN